MSANDSTLDAAAITRARAMLEPPPPQRERLWPMLSAAAFLALAALAFAAAMITAPPLVTYPVEKTAPS